MTPGFFTIPVGVNYLTGQGSCHLEAGLGVTGVLVKGDYSTADILGNTFSNTSNKFGVAFVPGIGYRYAAPGKGFQFRVVLSPLISVGTVFFGGISVGYKF